MKKYRYTVEYTLTAPDGTVIDSTEGREPFSFTTGPVSYTHLTLPTKA